MNEIHSTITTTIAMTINKMRGSAQDQHKIKLLVYLGNTPRSVQYNFFLYKCTRTFTVEPYSCLHLILALVFSTESLLNHDSTIKSKLLIESPMVDQIAIFSKIIIKTAIQSNFNLQNIIAFETLTNSNQSANH